MTRTLKKFGPLKPNPEKTGALEKKLSETQRLLAEDPDFISRLEDDPEGTLSALGLAGDNIRKFRLLKDVTTKAGCSCSCWPLVDGSGVGCFGGPNGPPGSVG